MRGASNPEKVQRFIDVQLFVSNLVNSTELKGQIPIDRNS